jgi:isocitrate dehydrogenase kinase/phosphatase
VGHLDAEGQADRGLKMFPQRLDSPLAYDIAKAMMDGFNRHYQLFRTESARAKHRFETADWHGQQRAQRERIEFYDLRVREASMRLEREFKAGEQSMDVWQQVKLHYIGLLVNHQQPELAETFFNSVTTEILHRSYFQNDFIFVRPAVSTEYIENEEPTAQPTYRAYYPKAGNGAETVANILRDFDLRPEFEDLERDTGYVAQALTERFTDIKLRANFQIQVLSSLFFRNKGAYVVGRVINGFVELPFALPILHSKGGKLEIDAALFGEDDLLMLFSFARAYFMVDMGIPSAYVQFLRSMMPRMPRAEKHVYIERRMIPLNIYLQEAFDVGATEPVAKAQIEHAVIEYGNAIKDLVAANIFPGDMLWKNFGITRHGKVVFYDYDEIEYITDCNFRNVPASRNEEDEVSGEVWYSVGPKDVFPETFGPFLLGNDAVREVFMAHHADLLDADFWKSRQTRIREGYVHDVFPYEREKRFSISHRHPAG